MEMKMELSNPDNSSPEKNRILVVDDEPGWRELLEFELNNQGYEVLSVANPEQALQALSQQTFSYVITDIRMPGKMDGIDFILEFWRQKAHQKVIFITGYAMEEKIEMALHGPAICLRKPFDYEDLLNAIQALPA